MSQATRKFSVSQVLRGGIDAALEAIGVMIEDLFAAVNSVSIGQPTDAKKPQQIDGVWLVAQFGAAATNKTFSHNLGRMPVGFIEVGTFPDAGETQVDGEVRMVSVTATQVVMQCAGANKKARLILF